MNPLTYEDVAEVVLSDIRTIYPTFRKPHHAITESWARVLSRSHLQIPAAVWREAVTTWSVSNDEPPTPHGLVTAAKQVLAQWESDPDRRAALEEFRVARLRDRESRGELPPGTAPESTQDAPLAVETSRDDTRAQWAELKAGIAARARQRRDDERSQHDEVRHRLDTTEPPGEEAPG